MRQLFSTGNIGGSLWQILLSSLDPARTESSMSLSAALALRIGRSFLHNPALAEQDLSRGGPLTHHRTTRSNYTKIGQKGSFGSPISYPPFALTWPRV